MTGYDELFMTDKERAENKLPKIYDVSLSEIDDFPDHPFQVRLDEDMQQIVESINERGLITPIMLRQKEDGRYEIVSGHRRKKACEIAGFDTIKAEIRDMTRDEAIITMVESNLQRSVILPSEKALAYKMRLEAMKRLPGRPTKDNSGPVVQNFSRDELGDAVGESGRQISRYIRLTELIPELLEKVDEGLIAMRPAVELSYLKEVEQRNLIGSMEYYDSSPSHVQAIEMRELSKAGKLGPRAIDRIMSQEKPNQKPHIWDKNGTFICVN
jgi:ParB family chromosome partitioning protein